MTGLLASHVSPLVSALTMSLVRTPLASCARGLLPYGSEEDSPAFVLPRGRVLLIGTLCFALFLAEGWSRSERCPFTTQFRLDKSLAGLGYVAFAMTMTSAA